MRGRIHTKFYMCRDNVCRRAPSPSGIHRPPNGGSVSVLLTHLFSFKLDNTQKTFKNSTYLGKATEILPPFFTEKVYFADHCPFAYLS